MDEIIERIASWSKGKEEGPFKLQLNPTNNCNQKCRFCWLRDFDNTDFKDEISSERYQQLIKEAKSIGVKEIQITGGGEPLIRNDVLEIMGNIKQSKIFGKLTTNGILFTDETIEKIVKMKWDEIIFSLDSPYADVNDYLRGTKNSFSKVVSSIRFFNEFKRRFGSEKPKIVIHTVLCNKNFENLPEMYEFAHKLQCSNVFIEPIVLLALKSGAGKELTLSEDDKKILPKYLERAKTIARKYKIENNLDSLEMQFIEKTNRMKEVILDKNSGGLNSIPCYEPWYNIVVRPDGAAGPCCVFDDKTKGVENIREKSLKEIWHGAYFKKIRGRILQNDLPEFCSKCNPSQVAANRIIRSSLENIR